MLQLIIVTILIFVLFYGIGFILNMLLKTTWFPIYAYLLLIAVLLVLNWRHHAASQTLWTNIEGYTFVDYIPAVAGLIGAYLSGTTIRTLRNKGYSMF